MGSVLECSGSVDGWRVAAWRGGCRARNWSAMEHWAGVGLVSRHVTSRTESNSPPSFGTCISVSSTTSSPSILKNMAI